MFAFGCSTARPSSVRVVDSGSVKAMEYRGDIHGFSGLYGMFADTGFGNALSDALIQAEGLGATHAVLDPQAPNYGGTEVHGKAYRQTDRPE